MPHVNVSYWQITPSFHTVPKAKDEVLERIEDLVSKIQSKFSAKVFIVACNTASTVVLPRLRTKFPGTHFIGVVPAIKPAASFELHEEIALLATPATIEREYIDDLINSYASHCEIIRVGDSRLAQQAELKLKGDTVDLQTFDLFSEAFGGCRCGYGSFRLHTLSHLKKRARKMPAKCQSVG